MVRRTRRTWSLGLVPILALSCAVATAVADSGQKSSSVARTQAAKAAGELVPPLVVAKTQKAPLYPAAARASRISGSVIVEVTVDVEGEVSQARALDCSHPQVGFEQAAVDAVSEWRFRPALHRGEPVEYTTRFRLNFGRHAGGLTGAMVTQASMRKGQGTGAGNAGDKALAPKRSRPGSRSVPQNKKGTIPSRR